MIATVAAWTKIEAASLMCSHSKISIMASRVYTCILGEMAKRTYFYCVVVHMPCSPWIYIRSAMRLMYNGLLLFLSLGVRPCTARHLLQKCYSIRFDIQFDPISIPNSIPSAISIVL